MEFTKKGLTNSSDTVEQQFCEGVRTGFSRNDKPHTAGQIYGRCWRCHKSLGCSRCGARTAWEVFCWSCKAWGTEVGLRYHGSIDKAGPALKDYPSTFRKHAHRRFYPPEEMNAPRDTIQERQKRERNHKQIQQQVHAHHQERIRNENRYSPPDSVEARRRDVAAPFLPPGAAPNSQTKSKQESLL